MVLALQGNYAMRQFGAEGYVGGFVAISLVRELGPVFTALMVTGRSGSAITTELGTMRVTEQIDAMESMAVNPIQYLVVPRVLAATLMMPAPDRGLQRHGLPGRLPHRRLRLAHPARPLPRPHQVDARHART